MVVEVKGYWMAWKTIVGWNGEGEEVVVVGIKKL
jgi:hypothetical protein